MAHPVALLRQQSDAMLSFARACLLAMAFVRRTSRHKNKRQYHAEKVEKFINTSADLQATYLLVIISRSVGHKNLDVILGE